MLRTVSTDGRREPILLRFAPYCAGGSHDQILRGAFVCVGRVGVSGGDKFDTYGG